MENPYGELYLSYHCGIEMIVAHKKFHIHWLYLSYHCGIEIIYFTCVRKLSNFSIYRIIVELKYRISISFYNAMQSIYRIIVELKFDIVADTLRENMYLSYHCGIEIAFS